MSDPDSHHYLDGKWDLYYHLPNDSNWSLSSYNVIAKDIDTVEQVFALNEAINEQTVKYSMLFLMRSGVKPLWEDPKNRLGGCFSFKVINKQVYDIWKKLFYSICGESLCINKEHNQLINGITISPKKHFCIIKIWLSNCELQNPSIFIDINNLQKQGCLFKKHEPEF